MLLDTGTVLEVNQLSKLYSRTERVTRKRMAIAFLRTLCGRSITPNKGLYKGEFWSLKDISFSLRRGEALGIIGFNGAGKTTLLRLLAGQLLPDNGEICSRGESAAMIDLTAGFQMTTTGQRNIFLRGAMLGRTKQDMLAVYDEIVEFAELGEAINAPVSTYSSGMLMRLAFSIMVSMKPDILFIDEILSVGDFRFRQKCLARIRELRQKAAIVLVSHSMSDIRLFCDRAIVLHKGEIAFEGKPEMAIEMYEGIKLPDTLSKEAKTTQILDPQFHNKQIIKNIEHYWCDVEGVLIKEVRQFETLYFKASFDLIHAPRNLVLGVPVWTEEGGYVTGFSTQLQKRQLKIVPGQRTVLMLEIKNISFNPDVYLSNFSISDGPEFLYRGANSNLTIPNVRDQYWGTVTLPHTWRAIELTKEF